MGKLWQRSRGADNKSRLDAVALADLRIDRPSVFFLTGFFTLDRARQSIAGSIKAVERALPPGEKPAVYAWSHGSLAEFFNFAAYNAMPARASARSGYDLAAAIILPLVAENFQRAPDGRVTGQPRPLAAAQKNLRNVTLFGYSAGTILAQECYNAALDMMQDIGFAPTAAKAALNEVVLISAGVMSRPARERDRFTTVYLAASNDRLVRMKERVWEPLRAAFATLETKMRIEKLSPRSILISAPVRKKPWRLSEQAGKSFREKLGSLAPAWFPAKSNHELKRYLAEDETVSPFAPIIRHTLANALRRTALKDPLDLLQPQPDTPADGAAVYRAAIEDALLQPRQTFFRPKGPRS